MVNLIKILEITILVNCGFFFSETKRQNSFWDWLKVMLCFNDHIPHTQDTGERTVHPQINTMNEQTTEVLETKQFLNKYEWVK